MERVAALLRAARLPIVHLERPPKPRTAARIGKEEGMHPRVHPMLSAIRKKPKPETPKQ